MQKPAFAPHRRALLITFEGIDGSGKSTQARRLHERLEAAGQGTLLVREPGGTALSEHVRRLLLDPSLDVEPLAEMLLFSAARAQLVARRIRPALDRGQTVVCDRFYDSTTAYQGAGRAVADAAWLRAFNLRVTGGLVPDRTYFIDVDPEVARARIAHRAGEEPAADRMETASAGFYDRVAAAYRQLAREETARFVQVDGNQPPDDVHAAVWEDVERLRRRGTPPSGAGSPFRST